MTKAPSKNIPVADSDIDISDAVDAVDAADTRKGIQSVEVSGVIIAALCDFKFPVPLKDLAAAVDMPCLLHASDAAYELTRALLSV